ncbi:MAG: NUDIX hydrolase [Christensenella sp.]|nr:NUDIX hydrolase [Christensenella sp.]
MQQNPTDQDLIEVPVSSEEIYNGKIVHLFRDTVRLPNGKTAIREVMRHPGAVCIVPLTEQNEVLMVRQFRHPFSKVLLEAPAGKLDPNEAPEDCARRELSEETGAEAGELTYIGDYYPSVAVLDENIRLYIARKLSFHSQHTDDDEFLRVERIPLKTLVEQVLSGEICDGKTQAAILKTWFLEQNR